MLNVNITVGESCENPPVPKLSELKELRVMLNTLYGVSLPEVPSGSFSIKEFCVGLIENHTTHPWRAMWETLPCKKRFGIAHSLFLFRKILPGSQTREEAIASAITRLTTKSDAVDPEFLSFIRREIPRIFRRGWDRRYNQAVSSLTLSTNSCVESSQKKGGARSRQFLRGLSDLRERIFANARIPGSKKAVVQAVQDGGKWRVVTTNSCSHQALRPLHDTIYAHLSKFSWLLRGDAKPSSFKDFKTSFGEEFVSGDYESATDNIPFEVYREMLLAVESTSSEVGSSVWNLAFHQIERELTVGNTTHKAARGQLMGSYLSFPFLCLLNYLIFKYSIRRNVPVRINGDDIVFRCTPEEREVWFKNVGRCGLVLSRGKTLVHPSIFTLNSSMFRAFDRGPEVVPFIRSKAYFSPLSEIGALGGRYDSFLVGGPKEAKWLLKARFLTRFRSAIWRSQRSLTRGLGIRVPRQVLSIARLLKREYFYLSFPVEKELPKIKAMWSDIPEGWSCVKVSRLAKDVQSIYAEDQKKYFSEAVVQTVWASVPGKVPPKKLGWARLSFGTMSYYVPRKGGIVGSKVYQSLIRAHRNPKLPKLKEEKSVWCWDGIFGTA